MTLGGEGRGHGSIVGCIALERTARDADTQWGPGRGSAQKGTHAPGDPLVGTEGGFDTIGAAAEEAPGLRENTGDPVARGGGGQQGGQPTERGAHDHDR